MISLIYEAWTDQYDKLVIEISEDDPRVDWIYYERTLPWVQIRYGDGSADYIPWSQIKVLRVS